MALKLSPGCNCCSGCNPCTEDSYDSLDLDFTMVDAGGCTENWSKSFVIGSTLEDLFDDNPFFPTQCQKIWTYNETCELGLIANHYEIRDGSGSTCGDAYLQVLGYRHTKWTVWFSSSASSYSCQYNLRVSYNWKWNLYTYRSYYAIGDLFCCTIPRGGDGAEMTIDELRALPYYWSTGSNGMTSANPITITKSDTVEIPSCSDLETPQSFGAPVVPSYYEPGVSYRVLLNRFTGCDIVLISGQPDFFFTDPWEISDITWKLVKTV